MPGKQDSDPGIFDKEPRRIGQSPDRKRTVEDPFWSFVSVLFFVIALVLLSANFGLIFTSWLACRRRRLKGMLLPVLLLPAYWILISIAAWKGMIQLLTRPFYWEKTVHGLDAEPLREPG